MSISILFIYSCSSNKEPKPIKLSQTDSTSAKGGSVSDTFSTKNRAEFVKELRKQEPLLRHLAQDTGAMAERARKLLDILKAEEKRSDKEVEILLREACRAPLKIWAGLIV